MHTVYNIKPFDIANDIINHIVANLSSFMLKDEKKNIPKIHIFFVLILFFDFFLYKPII